MPSGGRFARARRKRPRRRSTTRSGRDSCEAEPFGLRLEDFGRRPCDRLRAASSSNIVTIATTSNEIAGALQRGAAVLAAAPRHRRPGSAHQNVILRADANNASERLIAERLRVVGSVRLSIVRMPVTLARQSQRQPGVPGRVSGILGERRIEQPEVAVDESADEQRRSGRR